MSPPSRLALAPPAIAQVGARMARVQGALVRWLQREPELAVQVGGPLFLRARIVAPAALLPGMAFDFDYYDERPLLSPTFPAAWAALLAQAGAPRFAEVVRLFLLYEGHHIGQGMSYRSQGVGRARGWPSRLPTMMRTWPPSICASLGSGGMRPRCCTPVAR